jgi:hypothetical protein
MALVKDEDFGSVGLASTNSKGGIGIEAGDMALEYQDYSLATSRYGCNRKSR